LLFVSDFLGYWLAFPNFQCVLSVFKNNHFPLWVLKNSRRSGHKSKIHVWAGTIDRMKVKFSCLSSFENFLSCSCFFSCSVVHSWMNLKVPTCPLG
jgi:hypothetical protein